MDKTHLVETSPILKKALTERGLFNEDLMKRVVAEGTLANLEELPEDIRRVYVCSHDISPEYHVRMQAAFQRHTDNAVSKTVNFTHDATPADVRRVFDLAYRLDCKGVTIYRDGSRDEQVLNIGSVKRVEAQPVGDIYPRPRPDVVKGVTEKMRIGCGNLYITVNYDDKGICEVFTSTGKGGGCPSQSEATARLTSVALRSGVALEEILTQLKGIRCTSTVRQQGMKCTSCPDAIARTVGRVAEMMRREKGAAVLPDEVVASNDPSPPLCPECGAVLEHEGGCVSCRSCGYSKCN
jgi:ribonucleoside-diphosphate reductase alpha chain